MNKNKIPKDVPQPAVSPEQAQAAIINANIALAHAAQSMAESMNDIAIYAENISLHADNWALKNGLTTQADLDKRDAE